MNWIRRIFVEKKVAFQSIEVESLLNDLRDNLGISGLVGIRLVNRYDISGLTDEEYTAARGTIFSEPPVDLAYDEELPVEKDESIIAVEYLPGQYDQRADSAAQCIQIMTHKQKPAVAAARLYVLKGCLSEGDFEKIKKYVINPVDSREASLNKPSSLEMAFTPPADVEQLNGFIHWETNLLEEFLDRHGLAMNLGDLSYCRDYFKDIEKRDPFITEIKTLDTYWSDHCRHTTFMTRIDNITFEPGKLTTPVRKAYERFLNSYKRYSRKKEGKIDICLMNIATQSMKELRQEGKLEDLEISGEVNACSIIREVEVDGKKEEWLIMFKNETHNHPTEIEPFGGAATCLGGAIRDPLSGRAYVYQAMRVTGSGNPLRKIEETLPGKLPQRKITTEAAHGYSSYGNQIGLPTGKVTEIYHEGYIAKRMEVGAVIAAVARENVIREEPVPGDVILLVGGRTGRDGIGGATGSSKEHTEDSIHTAGAEVQKGNPPEERKIQRLFRKPEVCRLIKKCNDFGAGGVSVAIGELADGLEIQLDKVPKKYEGLDGTELAISESQERMAVVVSKENAETFKRMADEENLEASEIAVVTEEKRLKMFWRGSCIVDIRRDFIDTNGVRQQTDITVTEPDSTDFFDQLPNTVEVDLMRAKLKAAWLDNLKELNHCSQKGLVERFDSTVGGGTVLMPFGGKNQDTPTEAMAAKVPVYEGETTTATLMSFGFNPGISKWSPFHGAVYAVVEAAAKIVATGGRYNSIRTSLQEYFEKLGKHPVRWGKPFSALLGAYYALTELGIPAIGGKDSMSGSFKHLDVPPTLICFAVDTADVRHVISPEFKRVGSTVIYLPVPRDEYQLPRFDVLKKNYEHISSLIENGKILAARSVRSGGTALAISEMAIGNCIGFQFTSPDVLDQRQLFVPDYGSMLLEIDGAENLDDLLEGIDYRALGSTIEDTVIKYGDVLIPIKHTLAAWKYPLETVFPTRVPEIKAERKTPFYTARTNAKPAVKITKPRVLIGIFPGTNCEYETGRAFEKAGAIVDTVVFRNLTPSHIETSLEELKTKLMNSQILMFPGGFSAGDEPDGSGKFIAAVFRNPRVKEATMDLLTNRDGLILGICNGFQALAKLGLVPFGEIRDLDQNAPTLTFNRIGRLASQMVRTRVTSVLSPWFSRQETGNVHIIPSSHGEGRFVAPEHVIDELIRNGQVATQYVDMDNKPTEAMPFNPNGSLYGIEGVTSPDGRVLGKMSHTERLGPYVAKNIPGIVDQELFQSGVEYFG